MELKFTYVGGTCWVLEVDNKLKIACDPALNPKDTKYNYKGLKSKRLEDPIYNDKTFESVKIWLLTSPRFEHIDEKGMEKIQKESKIICRKECGALLRDYKNVNIHFLDWYKKINLEVLGYKVIIEGVPSYGGGGLFSRLTGKKSNGYLLIISKQEDRKIIFITGNTFYHDNIGKMLVGYPIDLMIANVGQVKRTSGVQTMDVIGLNHFINLLNPKRLIPIHLNDYSHYSTRREIVEKFINIIKPGETIEI